jgi:hypothetical protein
MESKAIITDLPEHGAKVQSFLTYTKIKINRKITTLSCKKEFLLNRLKYEGNYNL